jgi:D-hydroxyproline dehydrogenase subunit alpha
MTGTTGYDVFVVGAGPAGLSAAVAAARHGARVAIVDQGQRTGGQIWRHRNAAALSINAKRLIDEATARTTVMSSARVIDAPGDRELLVEHAGKALLIRAGAIVLATGAKERFVAFPGWTLPGVVGVGGLQALIKSGADLRGARVVIAGTGPLLFPVAATAVRAGADVALVAEQASMGALARFGFSLMGKPSAIMQGAEYRWAFRRTPYRTGCWATRAEGSTRLTHVLLRRGAGVERIACDWLATGAGLTANTELAQLLGCSVHDDIITVDAEQQTTVPGVYAAGECTGIKGDAAAIAEGEIAGTVAAGATVRPNSRRSQRSGRRFGAALARAFVLRPEILRLAENDTVVCRCEDVTLSEIDPLWTQRQAKLWARVGMGECQGAVCGPVCQAAFGWQLNAPRAPLGAPLCSAWAAGLERHAPPSESSSTS